MPFVVYDTVAIEHHSMSMTTMDRCLGLLRQRKKQKGPKERESAWSPLCQDISGVLLVPAAPDSVQLLSRSDDLVELLFLPDLPIALSGYGVFLYVLSLSLG